MQKYLVRSWTAGSASIALKATLAITLTARSSFATPGCWTGSRIAACAEFAEITYCCQLDSFAENWAMAVFLGWSSPASACDASAGEGQSARVSAEARLERGGRLRKSLASRLFSPRTPGAIPRLSPST